MQPSGDVLAEVARLGFTRDDACPALAHWANTRTGGLPTQR
ncbi:MAG: hypothetical protein U1F25_00815 [Rubrivivax sp.]